MGVLKVILALCIGWGGLYAAQHYWLHAMVTQIAEQSGQNVLPPAPALTTMEIDPEKLQAAIHPPIAIDTKKYERIAIESMARQIDQQNRAALSHVPQPITIPGMHH